MEHRNPSGRLQPSGTSPSGHCTLVLCTQRSFSLRDDGSRRVSGSVFFVPGICSRHTICPRQQAHVFLLVLPSPLLPWTRGRRRSLQLTLSKPERVVQSKGGSGTAVWEAQLLFLAFLPGRPSLLSGLHSPDGCDEALRSVLLTSAEPDIHRFLGLEGGQILFMSGAHHLTH